MLHRVILRDIAAYLALVLELQGQSHEETQHGQRALNLRAAFVLGHDMQGVFDELTGDTLVFLRLRQQVLYDGEIMALTLIPLHLDAIVLGAAVAAGDKGAHTAFSLESWYSERQLYRRLAACRDGQVLLVELYLAFRYAEVKNGFATLADKTFIGDFDFEGTIDVLKASTGKWSKCIFPYDSLGRPLPPSTIEKNKPLYEYLQMHQDDLAKGRDIENRELWYLFGRTQAIKDVSKDKFALNTIIKNKTSIRLEKVCAGKGLYSGLYILTSIPEEEIRELIVSDEFVTYIKMLASYKSGGYYTFASKDVEQYLNYKLSLRYGQSRISKGNLELF